MEKKELVEVCSIVILVLLITIAVFLLSSLIFYGIGLFFKFAFKSDIEWTFYRGMFVAFIYWLLKGLFRRCREEE